MLKHQLEENIHHGDSLLPLCVYKLDSNYGSKEIFQCHWHEEVEIIYIEKGTVRIGLDHSNYTLQPGQFIFINGGQLHTAYVEEDLPNCVYAIVFKLSFLGSSSTDLCQNNFINPLITKDLVFPAQTKENTVWEAQLAVHIRQMIEAFFDKSFGYELSLKGSLYLALSILAGNQCFLNNQNDSVSRKEKTDNIKTVLGFIENNYATKIYIDDLAAQVNMSRYNFCRFFKSYTGTTPIEYLNVYRVDQAMRYLQSGDYTVTEVAFKCGFENLSYFTKTFRKYKNFSPSKFKLL